MRARPSAPSAGPRASSPTLATGAPPAAAAAAALLHEIKAGGTGDAAAAPTPDAPAPKVGPDKLAAGPAASRTILASVGATGGYSSTRIAGSTRPAPPTTPPPTTGMPTRSDDNGKKKLLAVLAVVAILITAGIVVVAATGGSDHNSVQAGRRSQLDDSQLTSHQTTQTTIAGQSGSSTTVKGHKGKKHSKGGTTTSEAPTSTVKGSKKPSSSSHGSTATTVKGSPPTTSGGHTSHPGTPPPPSSPPTTKGATPGHLNVGASSIALTGYAPSYHLTLSNSGQSALRWNASIGGVAGGSLSPRSGQIAGGGVTSVTVSFNASGTTEGTGGGSLAIVVNSSASGSTTLPVTTDTRQPDTIDYVGWNTGSHCTVGSQVHFAVHFKAGAGAAPTYSTGVQVDQVGRAAGFTTPGSLIWVKNPSSDPRQVWVTQLRHAVSGSIDFTVTATDGAGQTGSATFHLAC